MEEGRSSKSDKGEELYRVEDEGRIRAEWKMTENNRCANNYTLTRAREVDATAALHADGEVARRAMSGPAFCRSTKFMSSIHGDTEQLNAPSPTSPPSRRGLRLWPGVVIVALQWLLRFGVPAVYPEGIAVGVIGGAACGLALVVWWLFFSRALWSERVGVIALMLVAVLVTKRLVHPSIAGGMMGMMLPIFAIPVLSLAWVVAAAMGRRMSQGGRWATMVAAAVIACGVFLPLRTGGITSLADSDFHWRWTPTPEEKLLVATGGKPLDPVRPKLTTTAASPAASAKPGASWPGFRGPNRDSIVRGVRIETNWSSSPPVELWRRPIGPGWSSFAVNGDLVYTQEQRGEEEVVACYALATGEPVWRHQDAARFWESNAGPGPRGTPTLHDGRAYTFGATGIVNALDALTGAVAWTRDAAADAKKKAPDWGFASSPLVVGDLVLVAVTGTLIAYDRATGAVRWSGPADKNSYSSPHLLEIAGVPQILLMSGTGVTSFAVADGKVLWQHEWKGFAIVQPAQIADGDLLLSTGDRTGARRIQVQYTNAAWTVTERWTTNRLKAYFNDYVVHRGHAYGFDGGILACLDLEDGKSKWKGGRYGSGQLLLVAEQDVLLVLGEQGGLALVAAKPEGFTELARHVALEGKTWNHPVLAGKVLLVRNDREMAAFRLP